MQNLMGGSPSQILSEMGGISFIAEASFEADPLRKELSGISVSYRAPTEDELDRVISAHAYATAGFTVAASTQTKQPLTWDIAVGAVSWVLYILACNCKRLKRAKQLMKLGSRFLEPAADLKHLVGVQVYAALQEWYDSACDEVFSLKEVSSLSPESFIKLMKKNGAKIIEEDVTKAMKLLKEKSVGQFLNLTSHLATKGESTYIKTLMTILKMDEETYAGELERNKAIFQAAVKRLDEGHNGAPLFWKLLKDITATGRSVGSLYSGKAWDAADRQKCQTAARIAKRVTLNALKDAFEYEHLVSWVMNVDPKTSKVAEYVPVVSLVRGWIDSGEVKSFGFNLFKYNLDVLFAAMLVRVNSIEAKEAMKVVTDKNGRKWKPGAEQMVKNVAKDGCHTYDGSDFETNFATSLSKSLLPVSGYFLSAPSALPQREKDGSIKRFQPLKELRLPENGRTLKESAILAHQLITGGEVVLDTPDPIGVKLSESLTCSNPEAITKIEQEDLATDYRIAPDKLKVGDRVGMSIAGKPAKYAVKSTGHKFIKRTGLHGLYYEGFINLNGVEQVLLDVPKGMEDTCEGFMAMHPDTALNAEGVYPSGRGLSDGWFLGENGLLKLVPRLLPWVPKGKVFVTPGFCKGKEMEVLYGPQVIAYGYKHDPNKTCETNRAVFHRHDLMMHACAQLSMELNTENVLKKLEMVEKSLLGTVECTSATLSMANKVIENLKRVDKGNLPIADSRALYGRTAYAELGEYVAPGECAITPQGEAIMDFETFAKVAEVTGGPDQDDVFMLLLATLEILRNPMCGGDGAILNKIYTVEGF